MPEFLYEQSKRYRAELQAYLEKAVATLDNPSSAQLLANQLKEDQVSPCVPLPITCFRCHLPLVSFHRFLWTNIRTN
jgi:hypothetical protein